MQQADEVLEFLNSKLGGNALSWKGDHSSIKFEGEYIVDFVKLDAQSIELVSLLPKYDGMLNAEFFGKLLAANYQGSLTGPARISLTPDEKTLALCCRLDVRGVDAVQFEELLGDFVNYVKFWNSKEAESFFKDEMIPDSPSVPNGDEMFVTRI